MEHFFPEILITYLCCFRQAFYSTGYGYFQGFIIAQLLCTSRKTVTQIAQCCFFIDKSVSAWQRFLSTAQWSMPRVIETLMGLVVSELGDALLYAGHYLLAVDTTDVAKGVGRMNGVQKWTQRRNKKEKGTSVVGHHWAICGLLSRLGDKFRCFPIATKLISGQKRPFEFVVDSSGDAQPIGFFQSVLALIEQVGQAIDVSRLLIVADAYFSKAPFLNPLIQLGICVVSRLRKDAVGFDDPVYCGRGRRPKRGKKWKLAQLLGHLENQWQSVTIYGKHQSIRYVSRVLWLRDVTQKVKVVVIATGATPILLLSTNLTLTAGQIIEIYAARFSLEIAIRELKQKIGFSDYQMTTTLGFLRFAQLCCCALSIGQLILAKSHSLAWVSADADGKNQLVGDSLTRLRRNLCRFVIKQILSQKSAPNADLGKGEDELEAILRIAA
jgi:hypothetical protein|tara:strand:+ start:264 stop:1583 length:1320 start_codon:yes stop_codon:yes gene_type:complete